MSSWRSFRSALNGIHVTEIPRWSIIINAVLNLYKNDDNAVSSPFPSLAHCCRFCHDQIAITNTTIFVGNEF